MNQPNIIFYFSDQQRFDTMGCYRNAVALPQNIPTLAGYFSNAGYDTAYIGKWHLASSRKSYDAPDDAECFDTRAVPKDRRGGYRYWLASDVLEFTSHGYDGHVFDGDGNKREFIGYRADCINNYAVHYLQNRPAEKPFFMFVSQIEPHHQNDRGRFEGPDGSRERFQDFTAPGDLTKGQGDWEENYPDYLGQCHSLDENVRRLVDTLKDQGIWDNTILIYTSDHGSHFHTRNGEYKRSCHESSIHVPLIAVGGPFQGGRSVSELVSLIDLPVTLLDCAGIEKPEQFDGRSLIELISGDEKDWPEQVFLQISESEVGRAIRTKDFKYAVRADADGWQDASADTYYEQYLYDLRADPYEKNNLIREAAFAQERMELRERLIACMLNAGENQPAIVAAK